MKNKPSLGEKLAFAIGDGGCNFVYTTMGSFLTLYYTDKVGIAAATIGTIMLLARLLDGVSDIVMGSVIDRTHTRLGKARPWLFLSAIPMGLGLILVFSVPGSLGYNGKVAWAAITYILITVVIYTVSNLSYQTLLSLISPDPKDRIFMSSIRFFFVMGVVLTINYTTQNLVAKIGWTGMAAVFGLVAAVIIFITAAFTKERNNPDVNKDTVAAKRQTAKNKLSVVESIKILFKNKYFILITIMFVANYTALGVNNGLRIYYARDVLGNAGLMGTLTLCFILPKMIGNLVYPYIAKVLGNWRSLVIGYILEMVGLILMAVMPVTVATTYIGLLILGIGGIPSNGALFAMITDVVEYGEWKTGVRLDGLTNSAASFGQKVGAGLGSAIVGWGLAWAAYDGTAAAQTAATVSAIKGVYTVLPIIIFAIGFVALLFANMDKINPQVRKELAERKTMQE